MSAPGTVLVHIGLPKTGTTSLQHVLGAWPNLAGKPFDRPGGGDARQLRDDLRAGRADAARFDAHLERSRVRPDLPVILSEELLSGSVRGWYRPFASPAEIVEQIRGTRWDVRVLVTLRRPRPWLRSIYRYAVHHGYPEPYPTFLARLADDLDHHRGPADWAGTIRPYDEAFGHDAVALVWFEDLVEDPAGPWRHVGSRLAVPAVTSLRDDPLPHLNDAAVGPPRLEVGLNRWLLRSDMNPDRGLGLVHRRTYAERVGRRRTRARPWERTFGRAAGEDALVARLADEAGRLVDAHGGPPPGDLRA